MSNYSVLKQDINNNIYENQTQQITGTVLNAILNEMTASLGAGYQFAGVATLGMNPGDPDQRVFYLAGEGIYTNFGGLQVPQGKLGVLKWDFRWTLQTIDGLGGGGANLTGYVSLASTDDLPEEGQPTLGYLCGTNLYLYVGTGGDTKEGKYQNCGSFRGPQGLQGDPGVGIASVTQTTTSTEDEGINVITVTKEDGTQSTFQVRNGSKGSQGIQGPQGVQGEPGRLQAQYKEVETLPTASADTVDYIYLVASQTPNTYDMYYTEENQGAYSWKSLGTTAVQLSDYATKEEVSQLQQEVGDFTDKVLYYGEDNFVNWYWDSSNSKFVTNANWRTILIQLIPGRTYTRGTISGYNASRGFATKPEVNVEITPISPAQTFVAGSESGIYWMSVTLIYSDWVSGSDKTFDLTLHAGGLIVETEKTSKALPQDALSYFARLVDAGDIIVEQGSMVGGGNVDRTNRVRLKNAITPPTVLQLPEGYLFLDIYYYSSWQDADTYTLAETDNDINSSIHFFNQQYQYVRFSIKKESGDDFTPETFLSAYPLVDFSRVDALKQEVESLDLKVGYKDEIIYYGEDDFVNWYWDGGKYVTNANWFSIVIQLTPGRTYKRGTISGYSAARGFSTQPIVNEQITPLSPTETFVAGEDSGIYWLVVTGMKAQWTEGSDKTYDLTAYGAGIEKEIYDTQQFFPFVQLRDATYIETSENYVDTVTIKFYSGATLWYALDEQSSENITFNSDTTYTLTGEKTLVINKDTNQIEILSGLRIKGNYIVLAHTYVGAIQSGFLLNFRLRDIATWDRGVRFEYFSDKEINQYVTQIRRNNPLNLLLFSDIHGDGTRLKRILEFRKQYRFYLDGIIHGGDTVVREFSDGITFWSELADAGAKLVMNVIGNHDTAEIIGGEYDWKAKTALECYNQYFAPFVSNWSGVVFPADASTGGKCYYYRDYADKGIRLVVLDSMVMNSADSNYDAEQITWFENVLADAINESLSVLIVTHCPPLSTPIDCQFTSNFFDGNGYFGGTYGGDSVFITAVDTFINNGGDFIAWVCGDTHKDYIGHVNGATNTQAIIVVSCALCTQTASNAINRIENTPSEDLFNIISIFPSRHTIRLKRIGAYIDVDFKSHSSVCYDYKAHKLISSR